MNNLPAKSNSRGIQQAHVRRVKTKRGIKTVIVNPRVKHIKENGQVKEWKRVFKVDDGTNYPVSHSFKTINENTLFQHYNKGVAIKDHTDVARLVRELGNKDKEFLVVFGLNSSNRVVFKEIVSVGTLNSSLVHPREIFKKAILYSCHAIILAHNHPAGSCIPSAEDERVTHIIKEAGDIIGIKVLDHVIICKDGARSST